MKKAKQIHVRREKLTPTQTAQFLEDFRNAVGGVDEKTILISVRVPANVLNAFKVLAQTRGQKYQSRLVELMREELSRSRKLSKV